MESKKKQKNYVITYQMAEELPVDSQSKIDRAFDILFDSILNNDIDNNRQQGVYCEYGISNKKRGCEIL